MVLAHGKANVGPKGTAHSPRESILGNRREHDSVGEDSRPPAAPVMA